MWLLPPIARNLPCRAAPCRFLGKDWLGLAGGVAWRVAKAVGVPEAARGAVKQIGSLCLLGVLGLPFLGAFLSRSSTVRIPLLTVGAIIAIIYVSLEIFWFVFWEGMPTS